MTQALWIVLIVLAIIALLLLIIANVDVNVKG